MKTTLTKLQQKVFQFASPSTIRRDLNAVLFDGVKAVATDSFRLVETTKLTTIGEAIPATLIARASLKAIKTVKADTVIEVETVSGRTFATPDSMRLGSYALDTFSAENYPKYETLKDAAEKRKYIEVNLSGEYLAEIAGYLAQFQSNGAIKLRVPSNPKDKSAPVILEAQSKTEHGYAMIMPLRQ